MAHMITAECINCTACAMDCPVRAIRPGPNQFVIEASVCVDCAGYFDVPRCQRVCPVGACMPERDHYLERAAALINRGSPPVVLTRGAPTGRVLVAEA